MALLSNVRYLAHGFSVVRKSYQAQSLGYSYKHSMKSYLPFSRGYRTSSMRRAVTSFVHEEKGGIDVAIVPCLVDNYAFILYDSLSGCTAVVDTPSAEAVQSVLQEKGWGLTHIFNTHHHEDHTGGNLALREKYPTVEIIGPSLEQDLIPGIDKCVVGGDHFVWGDHKIDVIDVAGHTKGQIAFHFPDNDMVFVGDAIFSLGCGRLFEGSAKQAYNSLLRIKKLPHNTKIYSAHEYTSENARFASSIEGPDGTNTNPELTQRISEINRRRSLNLPTIPTTVGLEIKTNPFLRPCQVRTALNLKANTDIDVFAEIRRRKDVF